MSFDAHSKRESWTFQYTASALAEAAGRQRDFRKERQQWWSNKKSELMDVIRKDGVEITESVVDQMQKMSSYNTTTVGPQVNIKPELRQQLAECHAKIQTHRETAAEYDGWAQVLSDINNRGKTLELTQDDWLYFFGKR